MNKEDFLKRLPAAENDPLAGLIECLEAKGISFDDVYDDPEVMLGANDDYGSYLNIFDDDEDGLISYAFDYAFAIGLIDKDIPEEPKDHALHLANTASAFLFKRIGEVKKGGGNE